MSIPVVRLAVLGLAIALPLNAAAQSNPITQALRNTWSQAKANVRRSADVMPEAKYSFKPVDSVRSYGAILAHLDFLDEQIELLSDAIEEQLAPFWGGG